MTETLTPSLSVIITVDERPEDLGAMYREVSAAFAAAGVTTEILFVSQPEHRRLLEALEPLVAKGEPVRTYLAAQHLSEAALLKLGARNATAPVVITMPAYHRIVAEALPKLLEPLRNGAEVVVARRWPRREDAWINRLQNTAFHALVTPPARSRRLHDVASGVRAMRRDVLAEMTLYGDFARYLPILAQRDGYEVVELDLPQHPADRQPRVYSPLTYPLRVVDALGLYFLNRFKEKPLRFFGLLGGTIALLGGLLLLLLFVQRIGGHGISNRPLLLLAVLLVVMGVQAVALGLVGEIIVHLGASRQRNYRLASPSDGDKG